MSYYVIKINKNYLCGLKDVSMFGYTMPSFTYSSDRKNAWRLPDKDTVDMVVKILMQDTMLPLRSVKVTSK